MPPANSVFSEEAISDLEESLKVALAHEYHRLDDVRKSIPKRVDFHRFDGATAPQRVVATVATDGGENQLRLDPIRLHVLRVANSSGHFYFQGFIAQSLQAEQILELYFKNNRPLHRLHRDLGTSPEDFLPRDDQSWARANLLGLLRELMEWGALLELVSVAAPPQLLAVRDGLLRTVAIRQEIWNLLKARFEHYHNRFGHQLVGVAKRSAVLNYLSLAFGLDQLLPEGEAGWATIPRDLEQEASPRSYAWVGPRNMGQLVLARLTPHSGLAYACEVPGWLGADTPAIMAALAQDAKQGYPSTGYPLSLSEAHRHAHIGGIEITFLEQLLLNQLRERDPHIAQEVALQQMLGRRLSLPDEESQDA
ncbi:MAG TPA: DNA double-strand break repair nuclease NurA [bacterium]|nr:DNA double-strand break repair nuclease NurA [bacterium]